ncbi:hypothetical protein [Natronobacterium gregoryi]|uniref:DUF7974 domain-containing protein n=2 Tax=Natronobacterium gregoryi TaxID=44930 RepID=L0ADR1_NATGS|nr:hypothetical protein [Natronobacterium gregoryi]AFZ72043.1 hypothetical protein Natgr_0802 [Natronobacterium gregoryi SP2]ELY62681.1 hypothetical protein C490_17252 [Natronobacterium gregoryi SP2]PLK20892.1 hypothetical protein CYV19_07400 [Natronobacterium gregoryi SP2]SFJ20545.1 hypothetical protein SAMN05443661_11782 [Natronobacterium gregoryi]
MRRIYESDALTRDDDPFSPSEHDSTTKPQAARSINGSAWSKRLIPHWLRRRAISVDVSTPTTEFRADDSIPFTVTMRNTLPVPITIQTNSPVLWSWSVDDITEASHVPTRDPPERTGELHFDRGDRRQFKKTWSGLFRVSDREWEPAEPGEYTISVAINVGDPERSGLADETTVRILE